MSGRLPPRAGGFGLMESFDDDTLDAIANYLATL